ncbi:MAG: TMEM164-related integral membrane acyltransferase [Acidimicrobiales bacterium]
MPVLSAAYVTTLGVTAASCAVLVLIARRWPGRFTAWAGTALAAVLIGTTLMWFATTIVAAPFSPATSLPLALCDLVTLVAAAALLSRKPILVELTYFWGLAASLQSLLTPDVQVGFPSLEFMEYVLAHAAIVAAAVFLVAGQRIVPRPGAARRVYAITLAYTAFVGLGDWLTGGDYMYLRHPPAATTMLSVLGPWPWYLLSAAAVAAVLLAALDAPFWAKGRAGRAGGTPRGAGFANYRLR